MLVPLVYPVYFSAILSGAAEALYEQDLRLVLSPTDHEHDREVTLLDRLMHGVTDGALIVLPEESSDELAQLLAQGYRFVVVDPLEPLDERASRRSPRRTPRAPTRRCGISSSSGTGASARSRGRTAGSRRRSAGAGYHAALAAAGIMPDPALELESNFEIARRPPRRRAPCSTFPIRRRRSSRSTTTSRSA